MTKKRGVYICIRSACVKGMALLFSAFIALIGVCVLCWFCIADGGVLRLCALCYFALWNEVCGTKIWLIVQKSSTFAR